MTNRKTIKITLPAEAVPTFTKAKARAEQVAMIKLSDTQYASRLIQWALGQQEGEAAEPDEEAPWDFESNAPCGVNLLAVCRNGEMQVAVKNPLTGEWWAEGDDKHFELTGVIYYMTIPSEPPPWLAD